MKLIPVSEAKARLTELVRKSGSEDIVLLRYGAPAAVLMSTDRYDTLMERLEDLEDALTLAEHQLDPDETAPLAEVAGRLGLRVPERVRPHASQTRQPSGCLPSDIRRTHHLDARGFDVTPAVRNTIASTTDVAPLNIWHQRAVAAETVDDVLTEH